MTAPEITQYLTLALAVIAVLGHLKGYFSSGEKTLSNRQDDHEVRLKKAEETLINHDRRIQSSEAELKHLPDKDTVMEMKLALAELKGTVGTLTESVGSVSRTVHRIDDWLREKAEK